jgi:hypothetical protein
MTPFDFVFDMSKIIMFLDERFVSNAPFLYWIKT